MRIAFVLNSLRTDGGVQTSTAVMANALQRLGHDVLIISLQGKGPLSRRLAGVPEFTDRHAVRTRDKVVLVRESLRDWRPDIVHTQTWSSGLAGRLAAMLEDVPSAFTEQTALYEELSWRRVQVDRLLARRTALHIAVSTSSGVAYASRTGVDPGAVHVIPNAIEPSWLTNAPARRLGPPSRPVRLLMTARLETQKNVDIGVATIAELRSRGTDAQLTVVGDGPLHASLERQARELDVGRRVRFEGIVTDVATHLRRADAYLAISSWEGCPMALLEAAAGGLPIIATRVPGIAEFMSHERDALMVTSRSPAAVADAVERLAADGQLSARLSAGGLALAAGHGADVLAPRLAELYAETAQRWTHRRTSSAAG